MEILKKGGQHRKGGKEKHEGIALPEVPLQSSPCLEL